MYWNFLCFSSECLRYISAAIRVHDQDNHDDDDEITIRIHDDNRHRQLGYLFVWSYIFFIWFKECLVKRISRLYHSS